MPGMRALAAQARARAHRKRSVTGGALSSEAPKRRGRACTVSASRGPSAAWRARSSSCARAAGAASWRAQPSEPGLGARIMAAESLLVHFQEKPELRKDGNDGANP